MAVSTRNSAGKRPRSAAQEQGELDLAVFGRRVRHLRKTRGLTLAALGERVGRSASYLSLVESGRRDVGLSMVASLAAALGVRTDDLLAVEAPSRRAELEIAVDRAQRDPAYAALGLPPLRPGPGVPTAALEHITRLWEELHRLATRPVGTPEEARGASAEIRRAMRERHNYFPEIEETAGDLLRRAGYAGAGAVPQHVLEEIARLHGFTISRASDLPPSTRSVADAARGTIYLPGQDRLAPAEMRSVLMQTLGHYALGHLEPRDFVEHLRQRVETNYFAAAVLVPERAALPLLVDAKEHRSLSLQDLEEIFSVSYEMVAHRFTNLATQHLGIDVHFIRSDENGIVLKAYENDGAPLPVDAVGGVEGQRLCRQWAARQVVASRAAGAEVVQYTDTPAGTFWCSARLVGRGAGRHVITIGVPYGQARWFRGRDTDRRLTSRCPDPACCARPSPGMAGRWGNSVWPSARTPSHLLAAAPPGASAGVDLVDVYAFLERRYAEDDAARA